MKRDIQKELIALIFKATETLGIKQKDNLPLSLDLPANKNFGDFSTNIAFRLSPLFKKSAQEVAELIVENIKRQKQTSPVKNYIAEIKAEGAGFINFYLTNNYFYDLLKNIFIKDKDALRLNLGKKRPVLVEFVSANPTGPLSVAHARQAVVGDVLVNILNFLGFFAKREYYLNDEGNQIDILGKSIELRLKELLGEKIEYPQNYYQGQYIYEIAKEIQNSKSKIQNFSEFGVNYILKIIKNELEEFRVKFDYWYSQKRLRESGKIQKTLSFLKKKNLLYEKDGAVWFKSSQFGDDKDRVVIKSDGSYTYLTPDIAYHQDKFSRGFCWLINLWGPDHHGYIKRIQGAIQALGKKKDSLSIIIVQLVSLFKEGRPLKMSTRQGQYITLREIINEVGVDAARFFFLMRRTSSHLDFDLELAKKQTPENPVYYIQYAHARIASILRNSKIKLKVKDLNLSLLKEKEEIELMKKLGQFSYILNICLNTLDPYMLTVYSQELAQAFHKFYDQHRVLGEDEALSKARLVLIKVTQIVIATILELLNINAPEKM